MGIFPQFQGITEGVVHPAHNDVHLLEAIQGLHPHLATTYSEVVTLHQAVTQIGGQVGVLEIGFVVGAWGEDNHPRIFLAMRQHARQHTAQVPEKYG